MEMRPATAMLLLPLACGAGDASRFGAPASAVTTVSIRAPASPIAATVGAVTDASVADAGSTFPADAAPDTTRPASRRPGAYANIDPSDDDAVGPPDLVPDCDERLKEAGITYRTGRLAVHTEKHMVCGAPQVVTYLAGPGKIAYDPAPTITCSMALALASFERILQEEADRTMHSPVARIEQLGTYNCREMSAYPGWVSEHAYANAIDLGSFTLKSGKRIRVWGDFAVGDGPPAHPAGVFLRAVSQRAFDEEVFSHVLTPFFNAEHKNHFHLDLARYRGDGTRALATPN